MNDIVQFVMRHDYPVLFAALFAHQLGLPVPGPLFLLAARALAPGGKLGLVAVLVLAIIAAVLGDWPWYEAGRRHGDRVLHFIHRHARNPDAHDHRAKETFARYGPPILVIATFVPGLDNSDASLGRDIAHKAASVSWVLMQLTLASIQPHVPRPVTDCPVAV